jgi:hemolysin activation/secretion protein
MKFPAWTTMLWVLWVTNASAEEVGRDLNWQTLGSSNYVEQTLPAKPAEQGSDESSEFKLPSLTDETGSPGSSPSSLGRSTTVYVNSVVLAGATIFSQAELDEIFAPYLNREVSMEELQDLRLDLSRLYLSRGYVNSGVIIPDQKIEGGHIELQAIEGSLAGIEIIGDPKLADRYIRGRLARSIGEPLNIQDVKDALQNLQRDRNVAWVDARLVPGDQLGSGLLRIEVEEPERFDIGLSADNHHSASTGAERGRLSLQARNLSGYGDVTRVTGSLSEGTNEYTAFFEVPFTKYDTKFQTYYSTSDSDIIESSFKELDIKSQTDTMGVTFTQPIIDGLKNSFSATAGMEVKSSETTLLGEEFSFSPGAQNGKADTAVSLLGLDWINRGDSHVAALRGTYRKGLDAFDATIFDPQTPLEALTNPTGADGKFDVFVAQGLYIKRLNSFSFMKNLNDRAQLVLRGTAQISLDPLMSLEKLAIGGANTVRGYPENLLVRDNGAAATFELQFPVSGYSGQPGWSNIILAQFVDFGAAWDKTDVDLLSSIRDTDDTRYLIGAGLGVIWEPLAGLQAQVFWSFDAKDNFDGDDPRDSESRDKDLQDDGIHFSVSFTRSF